MIVQPVTVGGREISAAAIAAETQNHPAASAEAAREAAARALVIRQLLLDEAERLELDPGDLHDPDGRKLTREDGLIDSLLAHAIQTPEADPETCRRFYEAHPERFASPPLVEAEHILIAADPADEFAMGLATGDARTLIRQIEADPSCFAMLARAHSACPSRVQGGNLGQVRPGQMVKPFEEALFALAEHSLCPHPVRTRFGVHIVRSGRRADARKLPFEAVAAAIADYLEEASYRSAVAQFVELLGEQAGITGIATGPTQTGKER